MPRSITNTLKLEWRKGIWYVVGVYCTKRIRFSTRTGDKDKAKLVLSELIINLDAEQKKKKDKQATFNDCTEQHLIMCKKQTIGDDQQYIDTLRPYIGDLLMGDICIRPQQTDNRLTYEDLHPLNKFVSDQSKRNITQATINKKLSFLNTLAAKSIKNYHILSQREWINVRLINKEERIHYGFNRSKEKMALEKSWMDELFNLLPPHLRDMGIFSINTGQRDAVVCNLRWEWLASEKDYWMFRIPREEIKSEEYIHGEHVYVMLNDTARDIVLKRRGNGSEFVFPNEYGDPISEQNCSAYQTARRKVAKKYPDVMKTDVHSYKRTFRTSLEKLKNPEVGFFTLKRLLQHVIDDVSERYLTVDQEMRESHHKVLQRLGQYYDTQSSTPKFRLHYDAGSAQHKSNQGG